MSWQKNINVHYWKNIDEFLEKDLLINRTKTIASFHGQRTIEMEHLLYAALEDKDVENYCRSRGVDIGMLRSDVLRQILDLPKEKKWKPEFSNQFMHFIYVIPRDSSISQKRLAPIDLFFRMALYPTSTIFHILLKYKLVMQSTEEEEKVFSFLDNDPGHSLDYLFESLRTLSGFTEQNFPNSMHFVDGRINFKIDKFAYETIAERLKVAKRTIESLIECIGERNNVHSLLYNYAIDYKNSLETLTLHSAAIGWYVCAMQIEAYRANYTDLHASEPIEYPALPLDLRLALDTAIIASGLLARQFPEIAQCQDDINAYAGKQREVFEADSETLDSILENLSRRRDVLGEEAKKFADNLSQIKVDPTKHEVENRRISAAKLGFVRSILGAFAPKLLKIGMSQIKYFKENIQSKFGYDLSKAIVSELYKENCDGILAFLVSIHEKLLSVFAHVPGPIDMLKAILSLVGITSH